MKNLDKDIEKVLIDAVKIQERVCEMGAQITKDYEGRELVLVGVLKGAMPFLWGAASVELAVCLNKKERREKNVSVKYVGFDVPDEFIVGYGCDYAEKYRNLPAVCTLKSKVYTRT